MNNTYKPGTIIWKLYVGDWEGKTQFQIADELGCQVCMVRQYMYRIRSETGKEIKFVEKFEVNKKLKSLEDSGKRVAKKTRKKVPHDCEHCNNEDCKFLYKRKCVNWNNCRQWKDS